MLAAQNLFAKAISRNRALLDPTSRVLEVSTPSESLAASLGRPVDRAIVGADADSPLPIPFSSVAAVLPDATFEFVVVHDLLEYVRPDQRADVLAALQARVSGTLIVLCACGEICRTCDAVLADVFRQTGRPISRHLAFRAQTAFPTVRDVYRAFERAGAVFEFVGNESLLQHYGGALLDTFFPPTRKLLPAFVEKSRLVPPIGEGEWDAYATFLFEVRGGEVRPTSPPPPPDPRPRVPGHPMYAVYHVWQDGVSLGGVRPIFVGRAARQAPPEAMTDLVSSGPQMDNRRWCELTAMFRVWTEGPVTDAVGFCHYRRFFDFSGAPRTMRETEVSRPGLAEVASHLTPPAGFVPTGSDDWIIVPPPLPVGMSVWDLYGVAHATNDYCRVLNLLARRHNYLMPFVSEQFGTNLMFATNMFVLPWALFSELCRIWFDLLREYEAATPPDRGTAYQNREIGFLGERLFDIWLRWKRRSGVKIIPVPIYLVR